MEVIDNDFTIPNGNTLVDPFFMTYLQPPYTHHQAASFHQSFTIPSAELCHQKPDKKRKRRHNEGLKPSDVIHVRAKRGQATDSHSLAERVRRKKINEKLKSLHDIVPGCHKTMGMAVMLDAVIKYIQSLQNQIEVEFLSMKLLAASLFHDFNSSDMDATEIIQVPWPQGGAEAEAEAGEMERIDLAQGYGGGGAPYFNSILFPQESFQNQ